MNESDARSGDPPGGRLTSATTARDVGDVQNAHGTGQLARGSRANFFRQLTDDRRDMTHEKVHADATDSDHHENVRQEGKVRI